MTGTESSEKGGGLARADVQGSGSPTPIFVIGTARSGTTWLANLLADHSEITAVLAREHGGIHESHLLSHTAYVLDGTMSMSEFLEEYHREDYFKLLGLNREHIASKHAVSGDVIDLFRILMDEFARKVGARYWVEKTPKHTIYYRTLIERFPDAIFVLIRRGFHPTLRSQLNKYPRPGAPRWVQILEKIFRYECDMKAMRLLERQCPERTIRVAYEDLVDDTQLQVARIVKALGVREERLESRFAPDSSFKREHGSTFELTGLERAAASLVRTVFRLIPFRAMKLVRQRRDRRLADGLPKYELIT